MFDFNKYSLKDYFDNANDKSKALFLGTSTDRIVETNGNLYHAKQHLENGDTVRYYHNYFGHKNKEFSVQMSDGYYRMHYIRETFKETLILSNVSYAKKITRKGEESFTRKTYKFDGRTLVQDFSNNEFIWHYSRHSFMQKINKNKTREYCIKTTSRTFELREYYNSKGVCTSSLLFFVHEGIANCSIQMNYKNGKCTFWCNKPSSGEYYMLRNIVLPNLKDASVLNLYNEINCFEIDLNLPNNKLYDVYTGGLKVLKSTLQELMSIEKYNQTLLSNMLDSIEANTISYEEQI